MAGLPALPPHLLCIGCRPSCLCCVCPIGRGSCVLHQAPEGPAAHQAGSGQRGGKASPHTPYPHHRGWQGATILSSSSPASVQAVVFGMWNLILAAGVGACLNGSCPASTGLVALSGILSQDTATCLQLVP